MMMPGRARVCERHRFSEVSCSPVLIHTSVLHCTAWLAGSCGGCPPMPGFLPVSWLIHVASKSLGGFFCEVLCTVYLMLGCGLPSPRTPWHHLLAAFRPIADLACEHCSQPCEREKNSQLPRAVGAAAPFLEDGILSDVNMPIVDGSFPLEVQCTKTDVRKVSPWSSIFETEEQVQRHTDYPLESAGCVFQEVQSPAPPAFH